VLAALTPEKYNVVQIGISHDGTWLIGENVIDAMLQNQVRNLSPATLIPDPTRKGLFILRSQQKGELIEFLTNLDVIFPILHGTFGEDGTVQGLFELAELAYVGAGVLGSSLGMDKAVFKDVMRTHHIPVVESLTVTRSEINQDINHVGDKAENVAPYPLFVKPVNLGSSVGISKCRNRADLLMGLKDAARYDRRVLVERGVNAREVEISVLGNDDPIASVPGEVVPAAEFYSYEAKYHDDRSQLLIPAPLHSEMTELVRSYALQAYKAVDCSGMARIDFLLDKTTNELFLSELNTIPGFTRISMYPKLWNASGISYPELVDRLIELALERKAERDQTERRYYRS
jgi:D-alanine-D-alanine ligase